MNFNCDSKNVETRKINFRKGDIVMAEALGKYRPCIILAINDWKGAVTCIPVKTVHTDEERSFCFDMIEKSERIGHVIRNQDIFNRDIVFCLSHPITEDISKLLLFNSPELPSPFIIPSISDRYLKLIQVGFGVAMDIPSISSSFIPEESVDNDKSEVPDIPVMKETDSSKTTINPTKEPIIELMYQGKVILRLTYHGVERFLYECEHFNQIELAKKYGVTPKVIFEWQRIVLKAYCKNEFNK